MFEALKNLYIIHQNIFAIVIFILLFIIFLITKKNYKLMIPFVILFIGINLFCYNKTKNMAWERQFLASDEYPRTFVFDNLANLDSAKRITFKDSMKVEFNVKKDWFVLATDSNKTERVLHWCWVDQSWEVFSQTDLVSWIWGENSGKKIRGASEKRMNGNTED